MRVELKYTTTTLGELCVMIYGAKLILTLCANSWGILEHLHSITELSLVKELVLSGWIMFNVFLVTLVLEIAPSMDLPITTVNTVKMFL